MRISIDEFELFFPRCFPGPPPRFLRRRAEPDYGGQVRGRRREALPDFSEPTVEKRDAFVPEGLADGSPTPQGLRRDRSAWVDKIEDFGCAVVCVGDLARSAWNWGRLRPVL
jgi:hypothetical protein